MLYDPKWDKETKADPFSLESLIAWLEKQPAETTYNYCDATACLIAKYLQAMGVKNYVMDTPLFQHRVFGEVANGGERIDTYGAALARARKLLTAA